MTNESVSKWIENEIVPQLLHHDELKEAIAIKTEVQALESMKDNWASDMFEINLTLQQRRQQSKVSLLMKVMNEDENVRDKNQSDKQFFNEIHFYSTAVPFITSRLPSEQSKTDFESLFPKHYYSYYIQNQKPESFKDATIVMENLKVRDYNLGDRESLDIKHCTLALKRIGAFHAYSYFIKEQDPMRFLDAVVKPILETYYIEEKRETTAAVFDASEQRVIDGLAKEVPSDDPGLARLRNLASRSAFDVFSEQVQPQEPLSVLCHGDFLRNNVLFRYANGEPVDMKLIDFQMVRYASPVIDVSLFVCMNTSHALRAAHLHELLQVYHASLTETLAALSGRPAAQLDQRYSFEAFLDEFRKHAVQGYLVTIEFLPWMLVNDDELAEIVKLNWEERGSPRYIEKSRQLGGEKVTRVLVDLAKDLIDKNYL
ncbi:hypothetical protein R5R35_003226 [Gryllus longicercus]|uniref:CHK kinase-like domain-containing protein n=1 Tax=Gryllus longicercus TaxID=2509291 RepID=A0AAN9Z8G2_9ORTH